MIIEKFDKATKRVYKLTLQYAKMAYKHDFQPNIQTKDGSLAVPSNYRAFKQVLKYEMRRKNVDAVDVLLKI